MAEPLHKQNFHKEHKWERYPKYKDSSVEWLGEVPEGWGSKRLKFTADLINEKIDATNLGLLYIGLENIESWTGRYLPSEAPVEMEGLSNHFKAGDVLLGKLRPYLAKVFKTNAEGVCTSELLVLHPKLVNQRFLFYYFISRDFIKTIDSSTFGAKMPRANWDFIGNLPSLIPSSQEQTAIATFLDSETARIDALIEKKERLIALLEEKRAALISHAVTKGLDPDAKMKESGVGWIGMVPDGWNQIKIKFLIKKIEQGWSPECETRLAESEEWGVLKVGCVNGGIFNENENKALPVSLEPYIEYEIKKGDILMSRANTVELLGSCAIVENVRERLLLCDKLYRITPTPTILESKFLVYFFASHVSRFQMEQEATGTSNSMKNIVQGTIRELIINLPPQNEQKKIVNYIDNCCHTIDSGINKIECSINLLHEYRSALISSAVTGKIDVRQEAAV
ncbi:MAG: restriction endonuclease subunit S [Methanomicrobiales archaeon]